jgi:hypothetical protein
MAERNRPLIPYHRHLGWIVAVALGAAPALAQAPDTSSADEDPPPTAVAAPAATPDVLDPEWTAADKQRRLAAPEPRSPFAVTLPGLDRDGGIGGERPAAAPSPRLAPANPAFGAITNGSEAQDGSRSLSNRLQAGDGNTSARIGVDMAVPADRDAPLTGEPDPILRERTPSGSAKAAIEIDPKASPIGGIQLDAGATPTATGGQFQAGFTNSWSYGGLNLSFNERYLREQPMQGPESATAQPSWTVTHGVGLGLPSTGTQFNLSTSLVEGPAAPTLHRWSKRLEAQQSIGGPFKVTVGVDDNNPAASTETEVKAGVSIGF